MWRCHIVHLKYLPFLFVILQKSLKKVSQRHQHDLREHFALCPSSCLSHDATAMFTDKQLVQSGVSASSYLTETWISCCHKALFLNFLKKENPTGHGTLSIYVGGKKEDWEEDRAPFFLLFLQLLFHLVSFFSGTFRPVSNPGFISYEMKIGAITFQIAAGDITKEKADVIVNSTTRTFNLKSGTLFKQSTWLWLLTWLTCGRETVANVAWVGG